MTDALANARIAILGGRQASPAALDYAFELGQELGKRGVLLYCGGGSGIMEAAARGAQSGGGITVGILKTEDGSDANAHISVPIATGMGDMRNAMILRSTQLAVAIEGSFGTLSEIAYARSYEKPILAYNSWDIPGVITVDSVPVTLDKINELIK